MKLTHAGATAGGELVAADAPQGFGDQWQAGLVVGLIAQVVLLVAALVALLMKELPGMRREIRIMRMVGIGPRQG